MKAWEWLNSSDKWCQGAYGRDKDGHRVRFIDEAKSRCLLGVLMWIYNISDDLSMAMGKVKDHLAIKHLDAWNDATERTYEEVHDVLKKADV